MALMGVVLFGLTSCLTDDIPYPRLQAGFTSIECENSLQAASIDSINRKITFFLTEEADIANVKVTLATLAPEGSQWPDSTKFYEGVDLSSPVTTTVSLYQDYEWEIGAVQTFERYFTVRDQIGAATIDPESHSIVVEVPLGSDLTSIAVLSMKLAGPSATYNPDIVGVKIDFSSPVEVAVTEHGRTTMWTIYVMESETLANVSSIDAWTNVAWINCAGLDGNDNRVEYRLLGAEEWIPVDDEYVTHEGGSFKACICHLQAETNYQARAISGEEFSAPVDFKTEAVYSIPNGTMDNWWQDGKVWCPWPEGGERYWDTGNKGATTLGQSNSVPTTDTSSGNGQAACLETKFVGIGSLGKIAAGNLFVGEYVRTDGTNGVLSFGRPFTLHPTKVKGWMKYKTAPISHASSGFEDMKGKDDTAIIWCALIDQDTPFEIRTNPSNRQLFDPEGSYVVAYGKMEWNYNVDNWQPFEFELKYVDTSRTPKFMLLVASASWLGDYFTGAAGACLWVDDFSFGWDY